MRYLVMDFLWLTQLLESLGSGLLLNLESFQPLSPNVLFSALSSITSPSSLDFH